MTAKKRTIKKKELPLATMCARYRKLYGGPIMDALDRRGLPNQWLSKEIKPLRAEMVIAEPAVIYLHTTRPDWGDQEPPGVNLEAEVYPHCVVVVDPGKEDQSGHMGDITAHGLWQKGCQGAVIDGGMRDSKNQLAIPDWGCFVKFTSPLEQGPRERYTAVNRPIFLSGSLTSVVWVNPGDFIFGDSDGVIVIPKELAMEVLLEAEDTVKRENKARALMRKGVSRNEVASQYHVG